ncbi:hypothetical protein CBL_08638 [Carabus blaptoides fortunei]
MAYYKIIFYLAFLTTVVLTNPQRSLFDPIDLCIMACGGCYKGTIAVECANDCIMTNGRIGVKWSSACPRFNLPLFGLGFDK